MKFNVDFRLRYQYNHDKTTATSASERHRGRYRLRLGAESKVNDKISVGLGLATGGTGTNNKDYTRSTNQSFQDSFSKKNIVLDYAYARYSPYSWASLYGGKLKLKDTIWEPGDLIWDTDITPEGTTLALAKELNPNLGLFSNTSFFVLDEDSSSGDDPMIYIEQAGLNYNLTPDIALKGAISYYYSSIEGISLDNSVNTNTLRLEDFSNIIPAIEVKFKNPLQSLGNYIQPASATLAVNTSEGVL